jgi:membrane fusion protein (multidrug efflux system)
LLAQLLMAQDSIPVSPGVAAAAATTAAAAASTTAAPRSRRLTVVVAGALAIATAALAYWLYARRFETTDDAQVDGTISNVSPRVSGTVRIVYVVENQRVKEGDVLAEIDSTDLEIAVQQARAQVAQAEAQLEAEDPSVPIIQASNESALTAAHSDLTGAQAALGAARKEAEQLTLQIAQAEANDRTAQLEKDRSEKLFAQGAVPRADYDTRIDTATASSANVSALKQSLAAARDRVSQQIAQIAALQSRLVEVQTNAPRQVATRRATVVWRKASLDVAAAQLAQAQQNLAYAKVVAPVTGIVAKKAIAVGDHVAPGQQVVAMAQTDALWVTANYRETQLERMQPGQPADLHVDALDLSLHGTVESIGGATGSKLSVLPPENASGNYVKVVQRIPVRIRLDAGQPGLDRLRIGMSVEPRVTVR